MKRSLALLFVGSTFGCVVAQDLGGDAPKLDPIPTVDPGHGLVLEPDNVMPREQACPLAEPEAWSECSVDHAAPCVYPYPDGVRSAVCMCVLAGGDAGRWTCVGAVVRTFAQPTSVQGASCNGSFLAMRTCQGVECALCRSADSCIVSCRCGGDRVVCE